MYNKKQKNMKLNFKNLLVFIALGLAIVSCSKNEENLAPELTKEEVKNIIKSNSVLRNVFDLAENNTLSARVVNRNTTTTVSCFTNTVINIEGGNKISLDFGSGCDFFGKTYKGQLEIVTEFIEGGYKKTMSFSEFSVDGNSIEGNTEFVIMLKNEKDNFYTSTNANLIIKLEDGSQITRNGAWSLEKIEGTGTLVLSDDVYKTLGNWKSVGTDGFTRSISIDKGLINKFGCSFISEGTMKIVKGSNEYTIDFGDGTCDGTATFTDADGNTTEFTF